MIKQQIQNNYQSDSTETVITPLSIYLQDEKFSFSVNITFLIPDLIINNFISHIMNHEKHQLLINQRHVLTERKQHSRRSSLLSKYRIDQYFSSQKPSSFATAQDFFQTNNVAFMPNNTYTTQQSDNPPSPKKTRFQKYHELTFESKQTPESKLKTLKRTIIREALHQIRQQNYQSIAILKAHSLTPSIRKSHFRGTPTFASISSRKHNQTIQTPLQTIKVESQAFDNKKEGYKIRSHKIKRGAPRRLEEPEELLTGWNQPNSFWEAEVEVL